MMIGHNQLPFTTARAHSPVYVTSQMVATTGEIRPHPHLSSATSRTKKVPVRSPKHHVNNPTQHRSPRPGRTVRGSVSKCAGCSIRIRGRSYSRGADPAVEVMPYSLHRTVTKVLRSAVANAENNLALTPGPR